MSTAQPRRSRPHIPEYGISEGEEGMLTWEWVEEQLTASRIYWLATTRPDGHPHAVPSWGTWIDGKLYFGGGDKTRHGRNLRENPHMVVHLESGEDVVILETIVEAATDVDPAIVQQVGDDYERKYNMREEPVYVATPRKAFAWRIPSDNPDAYPKTATRFIFD